MINKKGLLKTVIGLVLSFAIAAPAIPLVFAQNEEYTKTQLVNVAQFKPVSAANHGVWSENRNSSYYKDNIVDDDRYTIWAPGGTISDDPGGVFLKKYWLQIDLLRKYRVEKIEVYDRQYADQIGNRRHFRLLGSNDPGFEDYTDLGGIQEADSSIFPYGGKFVLDLPDKIPFRYIRIAKTNEEYFVCAEIKVYAMQTATEVSRGKPAVADLEAYSGFYSAAKAVNGTNSGDGDAWVTDNSTQYHFLRVDLQSPYHIGMIEMEGRNFVNKDDNSATRHMVDVYGSNSYVEDSVHTTQPKLTTGQGYTTLTSLNNPAMIDGYVPFPPYAAASPAVRTGKYQATCNDTQAFRYITYKRTYKAASALGQFRAFVINPEMLDITTQGDWLKIHFSDEMDLSTLTPQNISFYPAGGGGNINYSYQTDDLTFMINLQGLDKNAAYRLEISKNIKNTKNVNLPKDYIHDIINLNGITVSDFEFKESKIGEGTVLKDLMNANQAGAAVNVANFSDDEISLMFMTALYDADNRLADLRVKSEDILSSHQKRIATGMDLPMVQEGSKFKAFLWNVSGGGQIPLMDSKTLQASMQNIFVSTNGSDSGNGTVFSPFKTITRAQQEVRQLNSAMTEDINVYLEGGTYHLDSGLEFSETDSGKNGYYVNYKAYQNQPVTISGGKKVTGWQPDENGKWKAKTQNIDVRELYVNGRKARRAQSENKIQPDGFYKEGEQTLGYLVTAFGSFKNPQDIQLHFTRGWRSITCNVSDIIANGDVSYIIMQQPQFESAISGGNHRLISDNKFYMENVFEMLDTPGEFYYDKTEEFLYYLPDGEDMTEAEVYVPVLETLVSVKGSDLNNKAKNITFSGFTFTHATWFEPVFFGHLGGQAQSKQRVRDDNLEPGNNIVPANIQVKAAENIHFENNVFTGLAGVGVGLYDGANNIEISANAFYDLGDSAISVGLPYDNYMEKVHEGRNLAMFKPASASAESPDYPARNANDGTAYTGWHQALRPEDNGNYTNGWWQVDLGQMYEIDRIEIDDRAGYDQPSIRRNFEVVASNDPEFKSGIAVLGWCGSAGFGVGGTWSYDVTNNNKYRYVRVRKTVNEYFYLAEIRLINLSMDYLPVKEVCKNNKIYDNVITRVGEFNWGAPGIQTYYTEAIDIAHNLIYDLPYTGIGLGWGWGSHPNSTTSKNNKIRNNIIDTFAQRNFDGGGIYTLGQQPGSEISGNYIKNQVNAYGAFYPDNGSADYSVTGNVFEDVWLSIFIYSSDKYNLTVSNNYSTTPVYENLGTNCTVTNTTLFIPGRYPAGAAAIVNNAGPRVSHEDVPPRRRQLTFEDKYDNVITEVSTSIADWKFVEYYLNHSIRIAENILSLANVGTQTGMYPQTAANELSAKIQESKNLSAQTKVATDAVRRELGIVAASSVKIIDRTNVLNSKFALENQVKLFLASEIK